MRIALLQPCYWPEVSRGTERIVHDIGLQLADRGHEVTLLTSHPGPSRVDVEDGIRVIRDRRPPSPAPLRWYEDHLTSAPAMAWRLARGRYDVANAFHPAYAWAAHRARSLGGPPLVFSFHGIPERGYLVQRRYRLEQMSAVVRSAAECTVLSEAAAERFRRYLLRSPVVLPAGYFAEKFSVDASRAKDPTMVCAASLDDSRKRGDLLLGAFSRLRQRRGDVRLDLVRPAGSDVPDLRLPDGARWVEAKDTEDVAVAFRRAWASVLAAVGEALGLVMIESLAAGRPVVAAKSGAGPELVDEGRTGALFEPDDEAALTAAMERALSLADSPTVEEACRARAMPYEWSRLIDRHEALYAAVAERARERRPT